VGEVCTSKRLQELDRSLRPKLRAAGLKELQEIKDLAEAVPFATPRFTAACYELNKLQRFQYVPRRRQSHGTRRFDDPLT